MECAPLFEAPPYRTKTQEEKSAPQGVFWEAPAERSCTAQRAISPARSITVARPVAVSTSRPAFPSEFIMQSYQVRSRSTTVRGGYLNSATIEAVWNKGQVVSGYVTYRRDACGASFFAPPTGSLGITAGKSTTSCLSPRAAQMISTTCNPCIGKTTVPRVTAANWSAPADEEPHRGGRTPMTPRQRRIPGVRPLSLTVQAFWSQRVCHRASIGA